MSRTAYGVRPPPLAQCPPSTGDVGEAQKATTEGSRMAGGEVATGPRVAVLETEEAKGLLEIGQEAGTLTAEEIALALDELELDAGQIEDFYHALDELQIEVLPAGQAAVDDTPDLEEE